MEPIENIEPLSKKEVKKQQNKWMYSKYIKPKLESDPKFKEEYNKISRDRARVYYQNQEYKDKKKEYYKIVKARKEAEKKELKELREMLQEFSLQVKAV